MRALRWLLLIPGGIAAAIITHVVGVISLASGHGINESLAFWAASDMNDWWVSGTITLILSRGGSGALSTWAVFQIAPNHKLGAARAWIGLLVALTVFLLYAVVNAISGLEHSSLSFGHWYRFLVEMGALLGGAILAYSDFRDDPAASEY